MAISTPMNRADTSMGVDHDESPDADDRMVDVLREFFPHRLADLYVRLADEIVGGREASEVGHGL